MVKINHNTLQVENSQKAEKDSDDEFFEESDEDDRSIEHDYNDVCAWSFVCVVPWHANR